jgi:hypothetical protein
MKHSIRFHCGNFERFAEPNEFLLITQVVQTDKVMSETGYNILKRAESGPVIVFCNNENTFNGLRRAIVDANFDVDPDVEAIFYPEDVKEETKVCPVDRNGRIKLWPKGMFDQVTSDLCAIITGTSRNKKVNESRKDQDQNTATKAS